jgi:choline transport protein
MLWAFARENGLPGSAYLTKVGKHSRLPTNALLVSGLINIMLAFINIGSVVAFNVLLSFLVSSYFAAFLLPACVMLHKRLTASPGEIPWGPFRLGKAGVPITVAAIGYSIIGLFFSCWPSSRDVDEATMNYSIVVFAASLCISLAFWLSHGRKVYTGPILELLHR